jgi:hypothetical protein
MTTPTGRDWIEAARRQYHRDGEIEVADPDESLAVVSCADPEQGAYVQAWVWVRADQVRP